MEEIWKDIEGYEGLYQISNLGRVKSLFRTYTTKSKNQFTEFIMTHKVNEKIIKQSVNKMGYYQVCLYNKEKKKNMLVHRLIAEAFIPNPENKPTVNHIDGNTKNNSLNNLEWATMQEQINHSVNVLNHKRVITKKCRDKQIQLHERQVKRSDGIIYKSIKTASNGNETLRKQINDCCKGRRKTAGGYQWEYV